MKRDGINREQALLRINAQKPDDFYINNCDEILVNDFDSIEKFENKCTAFFTKYKKKK